jgi:hypothetical protein
MVSQNSPETFNPYIHPCPSAVQIKSCAGYLVLSVKFCSLASGISSVHRAMRVFASEVATRHERAGGIILSSRVFSMRWSTASVRDRSECEAYVPDSHADVSQVSYYATLTGTWQPIDLGVPWQILAKTRIGGLSGDVFEFHVSAEAVMACEHLSRPVNSPENGPFCQVSRSAREWRPPACASRLTESPRGNMPSSALPARIIWNRSVMKSSWPTGVINRPTFGSMAT